MHVPVLNWEMKYMQEFNVRRNNVGVILNSAKWYTCGVYLHAPYSLDKQSDNVFFEKVYIPLYICIREALVSNIGQNTCYLDWGSSWFYPDAWIIQWVGHTRFFQVISNSSPFLPSSNLASYSLDSKIIIKKTYQFHILFHWYLLHSFQVWCWIVQGRHGMYNKWTSRFSTWKYLRGKFSRVQ